MIEIEIEDTKQRGKEKEFVDEVAKAREPANDLQEQDSDLNLKDLEKPPPISADEKREQVIERQSEVARERVYLIINKLLEELKVDPARIILPNVRVDDAERGTSYHNGAKNEIVIHAKSINSSTTYGEEILHWLRGQLKPDCEKGKILYELPERERSAVEEFFGFVGRAIVGEILPSCRIDGIINDSKESTSRDKIESRADDFKAATASIAFLGDISEKIGLVTSFLVDLRSVDFHNKAEATSAIDMQVLILQGHLEAWKEGLLHAPENALGVKAQQDTLKKLKEFCRMFLEELKKPTDTDVRIRDFLQVAGMLEGEVGVLQGRIAETIDRLKLGEADLERHVPGYAAGQRFLDLERDLKTKIAILLKKPAIDIYFECIFRAPENQRDGGIFGKLLKPISDLLARYRERQRLKEELNLERFGLNLGIHPGHEGKEAREMLKALLSKR
jgi:hypothetical protein